MHKFQYKAYELKFLDTSSKFRIIVPFVFVYAYTTFCDYLVKETFVFSLLQDLLYGLLLPSGYSRVWRSGPTSAKV
jgi:hypothetical protein